MVGDPNQEIMMYNSGRFTIRIDNDPRMLLVLLAFCEKNIIRYIVLVISMLPGIGIVSGFIIPAAYCVLLWLYIKEYGTSISVQELLVLLFTVFSIIASCITYPVNARYILNSNNFWGTIFPCLRYFLVGLIILPDKKTLDLLGKASEAAIIVETLFLFAYMIPRGLMESEDMNRSYQILPNVLFALNYAFNNKKTFSRICAIIGVFYCLSLGARGPVIIILVFVYIKSFQIRLTKLRNKVIWGLIVFYLIFLFYNSSLYLTALRSIRDLITQFGLSTRIVDHAIEGTITSHDSGRNDIYNFLINKLAERPIWGYGVYGEWQFIHWSAHNMYLELLVHFGVILGSVINIWFISLTVKSYYKTPNKNSKDVILVFTCFVFVRGVFGGSWLMVGTFFLVGFCLRELRRIRSDFYRYSDMDLSLEG